MVSSEEHKRDFRGITVLSLFDGVSCGRLALERAGIKVDKYFASEIKQHAIDITMKHFPDTIQLGDVTKVTYENGVIHSENGDYDVGHVDLLIGGSPCQDFSMVYNLIRMYKGEANYGLKGEKSRLFYEYLRIKNEVNPEYYLLENVKMRAGSEEQLNKYMGVDGIHINSNLVSFQNRDRIYWTNIPGVKIPDDRQINFQDYKDTDYEYCKQFKVKQTPSRMRMWNNGVKECASNCYNMTNSQKVNCVTRKQDRCPNSGLIEFDGFCRFLTTRELELAQTLPVGYTDGLSRRQAEDVIGDEWTVDVIAHILSNLKCKK